MDPHPPHPSDLRRCSPTLTRQRMISNAPSGRRPNMMYVVLHPPPSPFLSLTPHRTRREAVAIKKTTTNKKNQTTRLQLLPPSCTSNPFLIHPSLSVLVLSSPDAHLPSLIHRTLMPLFPSLPSHSSSPFSFLSFVTIVVFLSLFGYRYWLHTTLLLPAPYIRLRTCM